MIGFQPKFGKVLIQNGYILEIKQDLHVITHWWIHNKRDRNNQKPTIYQEALQTLDLGDDKVYRIKGENQSGISLKSVGNQSVKEDKIKKDKIKENNKSVCKEADDEYYNFYVSKFINPLLGCKEQYGGYPKSKIDKKTSYDLWLRRVNDMDTDMKKSSRIIGTAIWLYHRDFENNGSNPVYLCKLSSLLGDKWEDKIEPYLQQAITMSELRDMEETKKEEPAMNLWDDEK